MSFIKNIVGKVGWFLSLFPGNSIVFESKPDLSDNTRAVYDEMIRRGLNKKYHFVWLCQNPKKHHTFDKNVSFVDVNNKVLSTLAVIKAKYLISCNMMLYCWGKYQKSIYLCHGAALKSLNGYKAPKGIDIAIGQSEAINDIMSRELNLARDKFIVTGYPRNDELTKENNCRRVKELFGFKYHKIIVWYPTFRQHSSSNVVDSNNITIPIIHDAESAIRIERLAKALNILIVLKPHFSQDVSYIKNLGLDNILFINDNFFVENSLSSYEFVGGCDALITDYSSIYFDYLLCDKPIAAVWEDIEEYKKNRGFCLDIDFYMKGAFKVYKIEDFLAFLQEVSDGKDSKENERKEINSLVNFYQDNKNTSRVVDFIESQL